MPANDNKIEVENVNTPGRTTRVNRPKYEAMREAILKVIPQGEPGISAKETVEKVKPHLPEELFPGGETAGWWAKTVQLDLEAKGLVVRMNTKPLTFFLK